MNEVGRGVDNPQRRILHVVSILGRGGMVWGTPRMAVELLSALGDLYDESVAMCVIGSEDPAQPDYGLPEPTYYLGVEEAPESLRGMLKAARLLRRVIRTVKPEIVHSHLWPVAAITGLAARGLDTVHVVHIHDSREWIDSAQWRHRLKRTAYRALMNPRRAKFLACSAAAGRYAMRRMLRREEEPEVILNGIDVDRFDRAESRRAGTREGPIVVGSAGFLGPQKGYDMVIEAVAALRDSVDIQLRIAGSGSRTREYTELAERLGIGDRVEFCGRVQDMVEFYQSIDIFVLASRYGEGLPLTVLEAMASGCAVVATAVAGTPEAVRNGRHGLLVRPSDQEELTEAIGRLAGDNELRSRLARQGLQHVHDEFTIERVAREVAAYYGTILGEAEYETV